MSAVESLWGMGGYRFSFFFFFLIMFGVEYMAEMT